jgi:P4 family phage/plasmid primase-like protien
MLKKITWDDIETIIDDSLYDKCLEDESFIDVLIKEEKQYLTEKGIGIMKSHHNEIIVNVNSESEITFKVFPSINIHDCDENGNLLDRKTENNQLNMNKINNIKAKIIVNYLNKNNAQVRRVVLDKNLITFDCPICGKSNEKMWMFIDSFTVRTHSKSDCENEQHQKKWDKWKKDLKKLWNEHKEKKNLVFNMSKEYIDKIVKENFPLIIRDKESNCMFRWDEKSSYYIEMIDNENRSDLETLILNNFFDDGNTVLTRKQLGDVKTYIIRSYPFKIKQFEPCHLYNCKNGIVNLITHELIPHSKDYFFNYKSDIEYNPHANTNVLYDFINEVVTEDKPIELIGKILAHIHYSGYKLQKGFLFVGTKKGRNGKGTVVDLIRKLIVKNRTVTMPVKRFQDTSFAEYSLKDKKLYIDDDYKADYIDSKTVGLLNSMITGVETQVHQKNKSEITINYTCIPLIQCNKVPRLKCDDDGGFYQRWVQIHFNNEYGHRMNEFLKEQLLNDQNVMSSMLNLLIEGYQSLIVRKNEKIYKNFFKDEENNDDWRKANNPIMQFVDDCCEVGSNYKCSSTDLYLYYKNEWNLGGSKVSQTKFVKLLKDEYDIENKLIRDDNRRCRFLHGITCDELLNSKVF